MSLHGMINLGYNLVICKGFTVESQSLESYGILVLSARGAICSGTPISCGTVQLLQDNKGADVSSIKCRMNILT